MTLTYHAMDVAGNLETMQALPVRIDKTAPFLPGLPNLTVSATSSAGAVVTFGIPASDNVSGIASTQISPLSSGMTFPPGTTHVTVTVVDFAGNSTMGGFDVTVNPTRALHRGDRRNVHRRTATPIRPPRPPPRAAAIRSPGRSASLHRRAARRLLVAPGRYSATATFTSNDPAFTSASPWTTMTPDPNAKSSPAVVGDQRQAVRLRVRPGCRRQSSFVPRLSIYDPASNTWTIGASPSLVRAYVNAVAMNGKMYVAGGCVRADCGSRTGAMESTIPSPTPGPTGPRCRRRDGAAAAASAASCTSPAGPCRGNHADQRHRDLRPGGGNLERPSPPHVNCRCAPRGLRALRDRRLRTRLRHPRTRPRQPC